MNDSVPARLFCFGLGYSAAALAARLGPAGWRIAGTARSATKCAELAAGGIDAYRFERDHPLADPVAALAGTTHLLASIPPDAVGDPALDCHAIDIAACRDLRWIGYLSTTSVYGDRAGGWVDEGSDLRPSGERGRRRVAAEEDWLSLGVSTGVPVQIFRLAGIYGPGRNQLVALREGRARRVVKPGQLFSRVNVEDVAQVLEASMQQPDPGAIYNVADDEATDPALVVEHAASLLGIAAPPAEPFETATLSPLARSFYDDCKRVRNDRIKQALGVRLLYPTYREGLAALRETID
ncbi:MAG: SDR family oxidoreductase [Rhodospirillaceae bacterium]|nr:SDR family oxidoreductase [Rhodospirillaceae bacterium]